MNLVDEDLLRAANEVYELEQMIEPNPYSLEKAIMAVQARLEERVTERIALAAEALAGHMAKDDVPSDEAISALELFAEELRGGISLISEEYEPAENDIVEVLLVGEVGVYEEECPQCGADKKVTWSVTDRNSGEEFFFEDAEGLNVRLISRGVEEYLS
jgi:hypothetical protein